MLFLTGCGGGGGGGGSTSQPDPVANPDPVAVDPVVFSAGGVKGPLIDALVKAYGFDATRVGLRSLVPIAEGRSTDEAIAVKLEIADDPETLVTPLIIEVTSDALTQDLTSGKAPVITTLRTAVTAEALDRLRQGHAIYATPLSTAAVDLAVALSGKNPSAATFAENLALAAEMVRATLGFGMAETSELYLSPAVLTAQATTLEDQYRVAEVRTAAEALTALVLEIRKSILGIKPGSTVTTDQILAALAEDLLDGSLDGTVSGDILPALSSVPDLVTILTMDPATLKIPGVDTGLGDIEMVLAGEADLTCQCDGATVSQFLTDGTADFSAAPAVAVVDSRITKDSFPRVVSAISSSNNSVLLTFSKPMDKASAEIPAHYSIAQSNVNAEVGALTVMNALMLDDTSVELTTSPQNEVAYSVQVTNVRDIDGRQIEVVSSSAGQTVLFNRAEFAGTPPSVHYACSSDAFGDLAGTACSTDSDCWDPAVDSGTDPQPTASCQVSSSDFVDTDGDGITDEKESRGYTVSITLANGTVEQRQVTSDPNSADTDGDGIDDRDELRYGGNPRDADTDSDGLDDNLELNVLYSSPYNADSDGDGLEDGLEYDGLQTSPILADTDGDQLTDDVEVLQRFRNPRIADLPELELVPGNSTIILNETYTYTNSSGEEVSTESSSSALLSTSSSDEVLTIDQTVEETLRGWGGSAGIRGGKSDQASKLYFIQAEASAHTDWNLNKIHTTGGSATSSREAQRVLENSYGKGKVLSQGAEVTREVSGATINVDIRLRNRGNIAFTVSDIEVTLLRVRQGSRELEPLATLLPNSGTGSFSLGPFNPVVGPLVFSDGDLPPSVAEELLRNPGGIVFRIGNYTITDEYGRQFNYINQEVQDLTASLVIDYGFEGVERYQLAASAVQDFSTGKTLGGFDAGGQPSGLPLTYLLENQLGWERNPTTADAIVAGIEGVAQTAALGDDVQRIAVGTRGLGIGEVVIEAGPNGQLDSVTDPDSYNHPAITRGFDTSATCGTDSPVIFQGSRICSVASQCSCTAENGCPDEVLADAEADNPGFANAQCDGPQIITRVGGYQSRPGSYRWVALTNADLSTSADIDSVVMKPGQSFKLAFVQDLDKDGLFARDEFIAGSTDSPLNQEDNIEFGDTYRRPVAGETTACGFAVLPAFCGAEADQSVRIPLADSRDTDRDGMEDFYELNIGWEVAANGQPARHVYPSPILRDSDGDGLTDWQERDIRFSCGQRFYTAGDNRQVEGEYRGPLRQGEFAFSEFTAVGYPAGYRNQQTLYPDPFDGTTSPSDSLVGDDLLSQMLDYVDSSALLYRDKVAPYCVPDVPDPTTVDPDDYVSRAASLDPESTDTDGDGVGDGKELMGYDVGLAMVASADFADFVTDGDPVEFSAQGDDILLREFSNTIVVHDVIFLPGPNGIFDADYADLYRRKQMIDGSLHFDVTLLDTRQPQRIRSNPLSADSDGDLLFDGAELALGTNPVLAGDVGELKDSDSDGVFDVDESRGLMISVNGGTPFVVRSNPARSDTDGDGLPDFVEYQVGSNPSNGDTDGDGLSDYDEFSAGQFSQYAPFVDRFSNFVLDAADSMKTGTLLNLRDSDDDGLDDGAELAGFNLVTREDGLAVALSVKTNPLSADTDADGLTDQVELTSAIYGGTPPLMTNPLKADSDGDGVGDADEVANGTDPLEPDRKVTVRFYEMSLYDSEEASADWDWLLRIQDPGALAPGEVVNTDEEYIQSPLACVNCRYIGYPQAYDPPVVSPLSGEYGSYGWIEDPNGDPNGPVKYITGYIEADQVGYMLPKLGNSASKTFIVREGQSFSLSGILMQADLPNGHGAIPVNYSCISEFTETYAYSDIAALPLIQGEADLSEGNCVSSVRYEIYIGQ
ncbi:hypothetical protein [Microbulbifer sp. SAOS-129_SWC]|uniref:hypothetical protein n=1 Tax=Microbulbifer sp. SAOS-129_SWC TaxID=3145235 RepID=UPI003217467E